MNILPTEFRVLGGMWCGDVVALNGSDFTLLKSRSHSQDVTRFGQLPGALLLLWL
jgi:hypothetical protein